MSGLIAVLAVCFVAAPVFAAEKKEVVVLLKTSSGEDAGKATFKELKSGELSVKLDLKNLPFGEHAVHIHAKPLCEAPDFKSAGSHFNPDQKQHGTMNSMGHHNGDLPQNILIGEDHRGTASFKVNYLSMKEGSPNNILGDGGTSIMVHEKPDDMKSDPTGNAGNRIACGVISK